MEKLCLTLVDMKKAREKWRPLCLEEEAETIFYKAVCLINWKCCQTVYLSLHFQAFTSVGVRGVPGADAFFPVLTILLVHLHWVGWALNQVGRVYEWMEDGTIKKTNLPSCPSSDHGNSLCLKNGRKQIFEVCHYHLGPVTHRICVPHWCSNVVLPVPNRVSSSSQGEMQDAASLTTNVFGKAGLTRELVQ